MSKQRIDSLDIMKCFCILAVMALHCMGHKLVLALVTFLMGSSMMLFFLISGYNYREGRSPKENILRRGKQLLIPFVLYSAVICIFWGIFMIASGEKTLGTYAPDVLGFYLNRFESLSGGDSSLLHICMPYWFLIVMFLSSAIFFPIADFALKSWKRVAVISILLLSFSAIVAEFVSVYIPWGIQLAPAFAGILLLGAYAGKKKLLSKLPNRGIKGVLLVIAATVISLVVSIICGKACLVWYGEWGKFGGLSVFIAVLQVFLQVFMLYPVSEAIARCANFKKPFIWVGKNSMEFYMIHMVFGCLILKITGWPLYLYHVEFVTEPIKILKMLAVFLMTVVLSALWVWGKSIVKSKLHNNRKETIEKSKC